MKKLILLIFAVLLLAPSATFAHPGRTDSKGCHTCKTHCAKWGLKTGKYHCHAAKSKTQIKHYIKKTIK